MVKNSSARADEVLVELRRLGNHENVAGMARYGIAPREALGISAGPLRALARRIGRNHALASQLWATGVFEARLLAAFVAEPNRLTRRQARVWTGDFENWADCDGVCIHLFRKAPFAHAFAVECSRRKREFVKRAGFTLMATLAVHDKAASDEVFLDYLSRIAEAASDERNGVKKAVNWALRQIGKRNPKLQRAAIRTAESIRRQGTPAARWIASDALRELKRVVPRKAKG
jgi:3-methyladenine DNA glycosylase AlkD